MKLNKTSLLTTIGYLAMFIALAFGYEVASRDYPNAAALVGWGLGFLLGLKMKMSFANDQK